MHMVNHRYTSKHGGASKPIKHMGWQCRGDGASNSEDASLDSSRGDPISLGDFILAIALLHLQIRIAV